MKISSVVIGNPLSELKTRKSGGQFKNCVKLFLETKFQFCEQNFEEKKICVEKFWTKISSSELIEKIIWKKVSENLVEI